MSVKTGFIGSRNQDLGIDYLTVYDYPLLDRAAVSGTLWVWGYNNPGQLGDNTSINKSSPIQTVAGGANWLQIAAGDSSSAGIKNDGTLWMWGFNGDGNLGDNTTTTRQSPVQTISQGFNWSQLSISGRESGAIKTDGTLWAIFSALT